MRPISNVVDVTNYVMLALGNPLHAFDFATLRGGRIVVRRARPGEKLRTLDGVERELDPHDLLIADAERAIALAGIMGGEETEIGERHDERAARGGELRAGRDLPHLRAAAPAHRGLEPLGEGRRPVPRRAAAADLATELILELTGARGPATPTSTASCPSGRSSATARSAPTR